MSNGDQNLVVLTLYIIGVSYVFNRMVESIDEQIKFEFKILWSNLSKLKGNGLLDFICKRNAA